MKDVMKDAETLRYRVQATITMPARIELSGEMLRWQTGELKGHGSDESDYMERATGGCLTDFIRLADANPEEVLAFTHRRGVLGIEPLVYCDESEIEGGEDRFTYLEPEAIYKQIASRFRSIQQIMASLKKGEAPKKQDLAACFTRGLNAIFPDFEAVEAYMAVRLFVSCYWEAASIQLTLPGFSTSGYNLQLTNPSEILLRFGNWYDGDDRDYERRFLTRNNGMIAPLTDVQAREAASDEWYAQFLINAGYQQSASGEWVIEYSKYAEGCCDNPVYKGRPSALFSLLAFQLLEEVMLQEGTYACSMCRKFYIYNPDLAKQGNRATNRPRNVDLSKWGNSKPRSDRTTAFCSERCRMDYDAEDKRRRRLDPSGQIAQEKLDKTLAEISKLTARISGYNDRLNHCLPGAE